MTVHVLVVDPPRDGLVLPDLHVHSSLTESAATELYAAMVCDTMCAVEESGGTLLVNYRPPELLPEAHQIGGDPESELRELADNVLDEPDGVRYEVQVGSSVAARVGNTVNHLLREEDENSVAVLDGTAPTLLRAVLDTGAMKLRSREMIIGPASRGRVCYLGLTDLIDFTNVYAPPELESHVEAGVTAELNIDFLPIHPLVTTEEDLVSLVSLLRARSAAGLLVPEFTWEFIEQHNLAVNVESDDPTITRGIDRP